MSLLFIGSKNRGAATSEVSMVRLSGISGGSTATQMYRMLRSLRRGNLIHFFRCFVLFAFVEEIQCRNRRVLDDGYNPLWRLRGRSFDKQTVFFFGDLLVQSYS